MSRKYELYLTAAPGLEPQLSEEAAELGLDVLQFGAGGVSCTGTWHDIWRANIRLRGAAQVLVRMGGFTAVHLSQLDKKARSFDWGAFLSPSVPVRVEAICRKSKIYHSGAVKQRVERAITEELGAPISEEADLRILVRLDSNRATISLDTSGEPLHKRGYKEAVGRAPMRETMAALFLRAMGYRGSEPVYDPMCGSGSFVIEAAQWAANIAPGAKRSFAFEQLPSFDAKVVAALRGAEAKPCDLIFTGSDRDEGASKMAEQNAARAGVAALCRFHHRSVSDARPPPGNPGLVMVNPPYGTRIGDKKPLYALHGALGQVMRTHFKGWRFGLVTSDISLARATGLELTAGPYVAHGGLKVRLHASGPIA